MIYNHGNSDEPFTTEYAKFLILIIKTIMIDSFDFLEAFLDNFSYAGSAICSIFWIRYFKKYQQANQDGVKVLVIQGLNILNI